MTPPPPSDHYSDSDDDFGLPNLLPEDGSELPAADRAPIDPSLLPHMQEAVGDWVLSHGWCSPEDLSKAKERGRKSDCSLGDSLLGMKLIDKQQHQELDQVKLITDTIPRFHVLKSLGAGAMGSVYLATDHQTKQKVALKVLHPEIAKDEEHRRRFEREAAALQKLDHPVIPRLVEHSGDQVGGDLWTTGSLHKRPPYLAQEYIEGLTLEGLVKANGPVPEFTALAIIARLAQGLDSAHKIERIIHRDIKPANIIIEHLTPDQLRQQVSDVFSIRLIDFGLAKSTEHQEDCSLTMTGEIVGTPNYISPEQILSNPLSWQADLYALGCTLYYLLTGQAPYAGSTSVDVMMKHVDAPIPDPRESGEHTSIRAALICQKAMAKLPTARYGSYQDFIEACQRAMRALDPDGVFPTDRFFHHGDIDQGEAPTRRVTQTDRHQPSTQLVRAGDGLDALQAKTRSIKQARRPEPEHRPCSARTRIITSGNRHSPAPDQTTIATQRLTRAIQDRIRGQLSEADIPLTKYRRAAIEASTTRILRYRPEKEERIDRKPWLIAAASLLASIGAFLVRYF